MVMEAELASDVDKDVVKDGGGDGVHDTTVAKPVAAQSAGQGHSLGTLVFNDGQVNPDGHGKHAEADIAPSMGLYVPGGHGVGVVELQKKPTAHGTNTPLQT